MPPEDCHDFPRMEMMSLPNTTTRKRREMGVERVDYNDLVIGRSLGRGCFADVSEVLHFTPRSERVHEIKTNDDECCQDVVASHSKYAIKCIRTDFPNPQTFRRAAQDLDTEVHLLSDISHANIVKVYAKSASDTDPSDCTQDNVHDFFIVMDRLSGTLTDKMRVWKQEQVQIKSARISLLFARSRDKTHNGGKQNEFFVKRLQAAHDVASALAYLHKHDMLYRDLKADNVGFDMDGKVKLFDFGLARRLPDASEARQVKGETCYAMTKMVGSLPHMAPEVYKGEAYNEKADVYSFAILLWVIMTLELPYIELAYDLKVLTKKVMMKGHRPTLSSRWPKTLQDLLAKAWHHEMEKRPSMQDVCHTLMSLITTALVTKNSPKSSGATTVPAATPKRSAFF